MRSNSVGRARKSRRVKNKRMPRLEAVAVYDWKERKLVHFEDVSKGNGFERMMELQDKYYSKKPEMREIRD
jgi:hypothetical protein